MSVCRFVCQLVRHAGEVCVGIRIYKASVIDIPKVHCLLAPVTVLNTFLSSEILTPKHGPFPPVIFSFFLKLSFDDVTVLYIFMVYTVA